MTRMWDGSLHARLPVISGADLCSHDIERLFVHIADAYETSKMLCEQYYLTSPDMEITEVNCMLPYLGNVGGASRSTPLVTNHNLFVPHSQKPQSAFRHRVCAVSPLPHAV